MVTYGVWQGGMNPAYTVYKNAPTLFGTHVGNDMLVALGSYSSSLGYYIFSDVTYDLSYSASYDTVTYMAAYGVTYAATYYQDLVNHIRAVEWV